MSTFQIEGATRTFEAAAAIIKGRRVTFAGTGLVTHSTNTQVGVGVALRAAAIGEAVPVRLWTAEGTWQLTADGAIGIAVALEGAADGKVAAIGGAGVDMPLFNLSASTTADGDFLEAGKFIVGVL